jgi:hypothetical protein
MDASPETLAETAAKIAPLFDEPIVLTGSGAQMLFARLSPIIKNTKIYPQFQRGMAKELLEIVKSSIVEGVNHINSGPDYLRKSDAELNCD